MYLKKWIKWKLNEKDTFEASLFDLTKLTRCGFSPI